MPDCQCLSNPSASSRYACAPLFFLPVRTDEPDAVALSLVVDRLGNVPPNLYRGNTFERCTRALAPGSEGCWEGAVTSGNQFTSCGDVPAGAQ